MKNRTCLAGCLLSVVLCATVLRAETQEPSIRIGSTMPDLEGIEWLLGTDPLALPGEDRPKWIIYDCWATWCRPCIQTIPHLNETALRYAAQGLRIVGLAIWDEPENVRRFVEEHRDELHYAIALDVNNTAAENLMTASGQQGIPCAFIVDARENRVLWIGHPMAMDRHLAHIVEGVYDLDKVRSSLAFEKQAQQAILQNDWDLAAEILVAWQEVDPRQASFFGFWVHIQRGEEAATLQALQELLADYTTPGNAADVMGLLSLAQERFSASPEAQAAILDGIDTVADMAPTNPLIQGMYWYTLNRIGNHERARVVANRLIMTARDDSDKLLELAESIMQVEGTAYLEQMHAILKQIETLGTAPQELLSWRIRLHAIEGNAEGVGQLAHLLLQQNWEDANLLNNTAWELMTDARTQGDYTPIALLLAERAETLTMGENAAILDTLALAEFRTGNIEKAIEIEKAAIDLMPHSDFLREQLALFEAALEKQEEHGADEDGAIDREH